MAKYTKLGSNFTRALLVSMVAHKNQIRGETPYFAHLMAVCSLVLESGGGEAEAIAALLHDVLEDTNPLKIEEIEGLFGFDVAAMIIALSENKTLPKEARREQYITTIRNADIKIVKIALADKLHNLRCLAQGQAPELVQDKKNGEHLSKVSAVCWRRIQTDDCDNENAIAQAAEAIDICQRLFGGIQWILRSY